MFMAFFSKLVLFKGTVSAKAFHIIFVLSPNWSLRIEFLSLVGCCSVEILFYFFFSVSSYSSFIQNCLDSHNAVRAHYGVPALNWSSEIAVGAQKWANHLAGIDQLQHDSTATEGENLFYMYGGDPEQACDRAVKNWYQEVKNYDFRSPHLDDSTSKCV